MPEVEAWSAALGASDPSGNNFSVARTEPTNRTGAEGVDLLSRNANWSLPVLDLKGRAGLDLSLSLSYNSLVWTKSGSYIKFDADHGFPSPGFRLGFPVIQSKYQNAQGVNSYLMISSSGARTELRQVGTSNVYESADSSYLQLTESGSNLYVLTKDGTRLWYQPYGSDYQCVQIRDRNGNYISASYNTLGHITNVIDKVGRVVTFNYDTNQNLTSITQAWKRNATSGLVDETHTWATFGWSNLTIQTGFSGLTLSGVQNGQTIPVLTQVGLPDGSRYNFEYTSWGQVATIRNYASDNSELNHVTYDMNTTAVQTDCPRFTEERGYARDWNNNAEAVTNYGMFNPAGGQAQVTMPDGTVYKEFFYTSGWQNGLTYQTEIWSASVKKKWTTVSWTQDNTALSYRLNPRPSETNIYDEAGNSRRTTIDYASYGLPSNVREYAPNGTTVLRRHETQYRFDQAFIDRHILGVVWMELVYEGESTLQSKINYHHDWDYFNPTDYSNGQAPSTGFDGANYGATFFGRANVTGVYRYNVNAPNDDNQAILVKRIGYNLAGEPFFVKDAQNHTMQISYADSFTDGNNSRNTLAYPTTVTDAEGYSSTIKYNYTMGVVASTRTPSSGTTTSGTTNITYLEQSLAYDTAGRLIRATNQNNQSYQRVDYGPNYTQSFGSVNSVADESYTVEVYDGAGRVRVHGASHPGSSGGYSATDTKYDVIGRVWKQSDPTEVMASWAPTGDDAAGWVYTEQAYDWKGRPTVTTSPDLTTSQADYTGCGCAGGEVITLTGETLPGQGNRRQKVYKDVLGRAVKTEMLNWDGSIYSTVVNTYNARDQITNTKRYAGAEGSSSYQEAVMTYDGFGRLSTQKTPKQTSASSFSYNADDTVLTVTDARGAIATYSYNGRHLVTGISYQPPSGGIGTSPVSFGYDAAGNRTSMTDGSGSTTYQYNTLSRLESETRTFNGLSGSFTLSYSYNLAGELTDITDPFNSVSYAYDTNGRLTGVTGTGYPLQSSNFLSGIQYRAWGAVKGMSYGNGKSLTVSYDGQMQVTGFNIPGVINKSYDYHADGRVNHALDQLDGRYNRKYSYDQMGRVSDVTSGTAAYPGGTMDGPYSRTIGYDVWGNTTSRSGEHWTNFNWETTNYTNDKRDGWNYDAEGNLLDEGGYMPLQRKYDAAGRMVQIIHPAFPTNPKRTDTYDGDGQRVTSGYHQPGCSPEFSCPFEYYYYLRSSVLNGQIIAEIGQNGQKRESYVYNPSGTLIALHKRPTSTDVSEYVLWEHREPSQSSLRYTDANGVWDSYYAYSLNAELDEVGADMALENPYPMELTGYEPRDEFAPYWLLTGNPFGNCTLDGLPFDCNELQDRMEAGSVARDVFFQTRNVLAPPLPIIPLGVGLYGIPDPESAIYSEKGMLLSGGLRTLWFSRRAHGGQQKTSIDPNVKVAVSKCADSLFGVGLITFKPSLPGNDGYFEGILKDGSKTVADNSSVISVSNNTRSYTGHELYLMQQGRMTKITGVDLSSPNGYYYGWTPPDGGEDIHVNFTANDADTPSNNSPTKKMTGLSNTLIAQIHELGNSMSLIISGRAMFSINDPKKGDPDKLGDGDPGQAFGDCFIKEYLRLKNKR
jgi:YD repeat-containing protein